MCRRLISKHAIGFCCELVPVSVVSFVHVLLKSLDAHRFVRRSSVVTLCNENVWLYTKGALFWLTKVYR